MKTRLYQLDVQPGQPAANLKAMLTAIAEAKNDGVKLLCFPEMAVPGYLLSDHWERASFLKECEHAGQQILAASHGLVVVFGNVAMDWNKINEDGRVRKYNALFIADNGALVQHPITGLPFFIKTLMPNYREFDDNRYFHDPRKLAAELGLSINDMIAPAATSLGQLGTILCEDGWDQDYSISPLALLHSKGAELFINISSSPYTYNKNHKRHRVFSAHAKEFKTPLLYINCCGLQDNGKTLFTFDGGTCGYDGEGHLLHTAEAFSETFIDLYPFAKASSLSEPVADTVATQFNALSYGLQKFLARIGLNKVVVGVSGGIDSAVAAALYAHLLPRDNLLLVSMPGPYTSTTTKNLAKALAQNLDCYFSEIPIAPSVDVTHKQLNSSLFTRANDEKQLQVSDFVLENIQARDRSSRVLAAVAAAFGGGFTCNANKSEMTVGYSTLYGDLGGFLACLADLWKGEVYQLAHYLNEQVYGREVIPTGTIDIVPSAELSSAQNVDQGKGDPLFYPYHDRLFASWVERWQRATPEDNLTWYLEGTLAQHLGYDGDINQLFPSADGFIADLERWWNLYQGMAVAKRIQAPPVLAIKRRAFGFDHRESQLGPLYSSRYRDLKQQAIKP